MRKFWFAYLAKALVVFPGGFGTIDEMFEILTLAQTGKLSKKLLVILYGGEYWNDVFHLEPLAEWGAINEEDLKLLCRVDSVPEAFEELKKHLTTHHMVPADAAGDQGARHREDARVKRLQLSRRSRGADEVDATGAEEAHRALPGRISSDRRGAAQHHARGAGRETGRRPAGPRGRSSIISPTAR